MQKVVRKLGDTPELGGTQMMGTVGINYMPAITASMKCVTALEAVNMALKNTQGMAKQYGAVFANDLAKQTGGQGVILDRYGNTLSQVSAKTRTATQEVKKHSKSVKELANSHSFLQHRMGWFVSGAAFYGTISAANKAVEAIKDVETSMVVIRRTTNDLTADFGKMRTELLQAGVDFGHSWSTVQEAAVRWAQAGYQANEIVELTRVSLLGLNVAEMDTEMATQGLIAIMAQWGFQTSELVTVIDKLNKTSDNYAITTGDLIEGLIRTSGAARALNMSFEDTVGVITATRVASGRLGREVGNALNTIFSYITRQSTLNKMVDSGIDVFADKATGKLKPAMQLLTEFTERWSGSVESMPDELVNTADSMGLMTEEMAGMVGMEKEWTDIQKIDLEQAVAGVRRRSFLIALMRNFAVAQEVSNGLHNVEGYSMRQNAETMETLEKKVNALKTAFTMLAVEMGEAGVLEQMKGATDEIRGWIEAFEKLPPELRQVILSLGEAATILGVTNLAAKTFFDVSLVKNIEKGVISLAAMTAGIGKAEKATLGFGAALKLLASNPITWAVVGLGTLIVALKEYQEWQEKADERTLEFINKQTRAAGAATTEADELRKLSKEYEWLTSIKERTNGETERLNTLTEQLTEKMPGLSTVFDSSAKATEKYTLAISALRGEIELLDQQAKDSIRMAANEAALQIGPTDEKIAELKTKLDKNAADYRIARDEDYYIGPKAKSLRMEDNKWQFIKSKANLIEERKEIKKELDEALAYKEQLSNALNMQAELYEDSWLKRDRAITAAGGDASGGGSSGTPTETAAQTYERLNEEREQLRHQLNIGAVSTEQYLASLQQIEQSMRAAGIEEKKIWSLQEEIYSLGGKESKSYESWAKEQERLAKEKEQAAKQEASEIKQFYDTAFNDAMGYYRHVNSLSRSSRDEQMQYLKDLSNAHEWEKSKMWTLEEELFSLYQNELKDQQQKFETSYQARIKMIEDERDEKIKSIQEEIDALSEEGEDDSRIDAERSHNQKLADLRKEKQYHELRTGAEHKKAITDIERQMNEENRNWQQQIDDWKRDDRKQVLQQQIEDIKTAADKEKEVWKEKYEEIKENWDKWADNFAEAAINDPKWLEIGKTIGQQLANGFSLSIEDMDRRIANIGDTAAKVSSDSGYSSGSPAGQDVMNEHYKYIEETYPGGMRAYSKGQQTRYDKARAEDNSDLMQALKDDAKKRGYTLDTFDQGGLAIGKGVMIKDTIKPERILPPQLSVSFDRLAAALQTNSISSTGVKRGGDVIFNAPLFNAQKVQFEDSQDMEIFGREMKRHVESIR